ncbi:hypothetical protein JCM5353_006091 [Sporobolomyces roseus]
MADQLPEVGKKELKKLKEKKSLRRIREMFGIGSRPDVHTPAESPESSPDWLDIRARATEEAAKPAGSRRRNEEESPRPPTSSAPDLRAERSVPNLRRTHEVEARLPGTTGFNVLRPKQSEPDLRRRSRRPPGALPPLPPLPALPQPPPISPRHRRSPAIPDVPRLSSANPKRRVIKEGLDLPANSQPPAAYNTAQLPVPAGRTTQVSNPTPPASPLLLRKRTGTGLSVSSISDKLGAGNFIARIRGRGNSHPKVLDNSQVQSSTHHSTVSVGSVHQDHQSIPRQSRESLTKYRDPEYTEPPSRQMTPELRPSPAGQHHIRTENLQQVTLHHRVGNPRQPVGPPSPATSFETEGSDAAPTSPDHNHSRQGPSTAPYGSPQQQRQRSRTGSSHQVVPVHLKDRKVLPGLRDCEVTHRDGVDGYDEDNLF